MKGTCLFFSQHLLPLSSTRSLHPIVYLLLFLAPNMAFYKNSFVLLASFWLAYSQAPNNLQPGCLPVPSLLETFPANRNLGRTEHHCCKHSRTLLFCHVSLGMPPHSGVAGRMSSIFSLCMSRPTRPTVVEILTRTTVVIHTQARTSPSTENNPIRPTHWKIPPIRVLPLQLDPITSTS